LALDSGYYAHCCIIFQTIGVQISGGGRYMGSINRRGQFWVAGIDRNFEQPYIDTRFLATFFNYEISGLPDKYLMEIEENVNAGIEKRHFSKITLRNRKNMGA
jgi:hypothetical protein